MGAADNVWPHVGQGRIGYNWFYLTVPSWVGIMKMIARHASERTNERTSKRRCARAAAAVAVTAFSSHSVCTILLFAQNYAQQDCRTYEYSGFDQPSRRRRRRRRDVVRNGTVACVIPRAPAEHRPRLRPPSYAFSLFLPSTILLFF